MKKLMTFALITLIVIFGQVNNSAQIKTKRVKLLTKYPYSLSYFDTIDPGLNSALAQIEKESGGKFTSDTILKYSARTYWPYPLADEERQKELSDVNALENYSIYEIASFKDRYKYAWTILYLPAAENRGIPGYPDQAADCFLFVNRSPAESAELPVERAKEQIITEVPKTSEIEPTRLPVKKADAQDIAKAAKRIFRRLKSSPGKLVSFNYVDAPSTYSEAASLAAGNFDTYIGRLLRILGIEDTVAGKEVFRIHAEQNTWPYTVTTADHRTASGARERLNEYRVYEIAKFPGTDKDYLSILYLPMVENRIIAYTEPQKSECFLIFPTKYLEDIKWESVPNLSEAHIAPINKQAAANGNKSLDNEFSPDYNIEALPDILEDVSADFQNITAKEAGRSDNGESFYNINSFKIKGFEHWVRTSKWGKKYYEAEKKITAGTEKAKSIFRKIAADFINEIGLDFNLRPASSKNNDDIVSESYNSAGSSFYQLSVSLSLRGDKTSNKPDAFVFHFSAFRYLPDEDVAAERQFKEKENAESVFKDRRDSIFAAMKKEGFTLLAQKAAVVSSRLRVDEFYIPAPSEIVWFVLGQDRMQAKFKWKNKDQEVQTDKSVCDNQVCYISGRRTFEHDYYDFIVDYYENGSFNTAAYIFMKESAAARADWAAKQNASRADWGSVEARVRQQMASEGCKNIIKKETSGSEKIYLPKAGKIACAVVTKTPGLSVRFDDRTGRIVDVLTSVNGDFFMYSFSVEAPAGYSDVILEWGSADPHFAHVYWADKTDKKISGSDIYADALNSIKDRGFTVIFDQEASAQDGEEVEHTVSFNGSGSYVFVAYANTASFSMMIDDSGPLKEERSVDGHSYRSGTQIIPDTKAVTFRILPEGASGAANVRLIVGEKR